MADAVLLDHSGLPGELRERLPEIETVEGSKWEGVGDADFAAGAFERMLLIRRFEEEVNRLFLKGMIHGTTHLCIGEEAIPVGVASQLTSDDRLAATYRGHGHALALGTSPEGLMAEMMGRSTGVCGGRAGSMNVIDLEHGLLGCFGIVGGTMAAAIGAALAFQGSDRLAVACFGEAASNQAYFSECLNFAAVFALPVVFICENNLYGEYTPWEDSTAGRDIGARARSYGVPARTIDGNHPGIVARAMAEAREVAAAGGGPTLLECVTYRHMGHSRSDPATYRFPGELEAWKKLDPIPRVRAELASEFKMAEADLKAIEARVEEQIEALVAAASEAPYPEPTKVEEYADA